MKEYKRDYSIEIVDLYNDKKEAIGTQIIIKIPYN
jgi:hypothetical protein